MKVLIKLPTISPLEVQGSPEEVARLLILLHKELSPQELKRGAESKPDSPPSTLLDQSIAVSNRAASAISGLPNNRRQMVLNVLEQMSSSSQDCFRIREIVAQCQLLFPAADTKHLDQVIRDLANKTNLVESPSRGMFRLVSR